MWCWSCFSSNGGLGGNKDLWCWFRCGETHIWVFVGKDVVKRDGCATLQVWSREKLTFVLRDEVILSSWCLVIVLCTSVVGI